MAILPVWVNMETTHLSWLCEVDALDQHGRRGDVEMMRGARAQALTRGTTMDDGEERGRAAAVRSARGTMVVYRDSTCCKDWTQVTA